MKTDQLLGILGLFLYVIIGALTPTVVKVSIKEIPPVTLTFLRFLTATVVFLPIYLRKRPKNLKFSDLWKLLLIGSLGSAFNAGIFAFGVKFTGVIVSQLFYSLSPIIVAVFGAILIGERLNKYQIVGTIIGFFGLAFLFYQSVFSKDVLSVGTPFGNTIILIAVFAWTFYTIFSRRLSKTYSPITVSFFSCLAGAVLLGALMPIEIFFEGFPANLIYKNIYEILFLGVVSSALSYLIYQFVIKKTSAFVASLSLYLAPVAVSLPAIVILGEKLTQTLIVGTILILFGVFLGLNFQTLKKNTL